MSNSADALARAQAAQVQRLYGGVPPVVGVSGIPGVGKTTLFAFAFPRALWIAAPGALKPSVSAVGWAPLRVEEATTLGEVQAKAKAVLSGKNRGDYDAVVFDDFGAAVEATEAEMAHNFKDGRQLYKALGTKVKDTLKDLRDMDCAVGISTHYREFKMATQDRPAEEAGVMLPGALALKVPSLTDVWLHMKHDMTRQPYPASLFCGLSERGTRDRHHVCIDRNPPNLGEILREAGYKLSRPPGCEWHEGAIEHLVSLMAANPGQDGAVLGAFAADVKSKGVPPWQVKWILTDALDRREIRQNRANRMANPFAFLGITL